MRAALLAILILAAAAAPASAKTAWLCKPGIKANPCEQRLDTARFTPDGQPLGAANPKPARRRIDCFYVYPTVSGQPGTLATRRRDPELLSIARWQAARYARTCRVFAPVYRQVTLAGLPRATRAEWDRAYRDVRAAWRDYLEHHNRGRGVVLIGHSQGTFHLRKLLPEEIEPKRGQRRRIVSALLLGGNAAASEFDRFRPCTGPRQTRCVVAFSAYGPAVPADAIFGLGDDAICTNPAALQGGEATVDAVYPRAPFAPGTAIGIGVAAMQLPLPDSDATWLAFPDSYTARCVDRGTTNVLQITPRPGAHPLTPWPLPSWGLHMADANIALGDLERLVRRQAAAYASTAR
jgi:hypothetical protein